MIQSPRKFGGTGAPRSTSKKSQNSKEFSTLQKSSNHERSIKAAKANSSSKPEQASVSHFKNKKKLSLRHVPKPRNLISTEIFNEKDQTKE